MATSVFEPKRRVWFNASIAIAVGSIVIFVVAAWLTAWSPGRLGGLVFGTAAALVFAVDACYPLRRRLMGWPFRTAQRWLQFHIYGGILATLFVLIHIGFRLPYGQFGWWLLALTVWTTATGLAGVWLQKWIPLALAGQLSVEALYERIPEMTARLQGDAELIVRGSSDVLERFYTGQIRPSLAAVAPSYGVLTDIRAGREQRLAPFREIEQYLPDDDRDRLKDLEAVVTEKVELDVHYSLQRLLHVWLPLHLFPAMGLMGLLTVHILAVLYF